MRKKIEVIEKPSLSIHVDYDHLTVGELGNILIRLQAALRGIAGLSPGEYDGRYSKEQPRFITSTVNTEKSIDIAVILGIIAIAMGLPGALYNWQRFGSDVFRLLKIAIFGLAKRKIKYPERGTEIKELRVKLTRGTIIDDELITLQKTITPKQRKSIVNFLWSLTGPANKVVMGDEHSEIVIEWAEEEWAEENEEDQGEMTA